MIQRLHCRITISVFFFYQQSASDFNKDHLWLFSSYSRSIFQDIVSMDTVIMKIMVSMSYSPTFLNCSNKKGTDQLVAGTEKRGTFLIHNPGQKINN